MMFPGKSGRADDLLRWLLNTTFDPDFWADEIRPGYWEIMDGEMQVLCAAESEEAADEIVRALNAAAAG